MRKIFIITGILLVLLFAGAEAVNFRLDRECGEVEVKEKDISGEEDLVKNATVHITAKGNRDRAWDFRISPKAKKVLKGSAEKEEGLKFSGEDYAEAAPEPAGFYTDSLVDLKTLIGAYPSGYMAMAPYYNEDDPTLNKNYLGFIRTYKAFSEGAADGDESEPIKLNTLMEYYPMGNQTHFSIPKFYSAETKGVFDYTINYGPVGSSSRVYEVLMQKFKIPVQEDEMVRFADYNKTYLTSNLLREEGTDFYEMKGYNAINEKYCYFTFDTHTDQDRVVDTGQMEDGYGIYRVPLRTPGKEKDWLKKNQPFDIDRMTKAAALDPEIKVLGLGEGKDENTVVIVYRDIHGEVTFAEIDGEKGEMISKLNLGTEIEEVFQCRAEKEFAFVTFRDNRGKNRMTVLRREGRDFVPAFTCDLEERETPPYFEGADFDGEKLIAIEKEKVEDMEQELCDFKLSVYTEAGEEFCGSYRTSLTNPFLAEARERKEDSVYAVLRRLEVHWQQ